MEDTAANSIPISVSAPAERNLTYLALYTLIAIYGVSRVLQGFPQSAPMLAIVTLHVVPPLLFALLHGRMIWGWRGILVFFAISSVVSGTVEKIGITTGFPFGHYYFTDAMGPKISGVPVFLGLAYLGMGYLSWLIASLILGWEQRDLSGWRVVALPAFAALVMTSWFLPRSGVVYDREGVDLDRWRVLLWRADQQFCRVVRQRVHHLLAVRTVSSARCDKDERRANTILEGRAFVLRRLGRRQFLQPDSANAGSRDRCQRQTVGASQHHGSNGAGHRFYDGRVPFARWDSTRGNFALRHLIEQFRLSRTVHPTFWNPEVGSRDAHLRVTVYSIVLIASINFACHVCAPPGRTKGTRRELWNTTHT